MGAAFLVTAPLVLLRGAQPLLGTLIWMGVWWLAGLSAVYAGYKILFDAITLLIVVRLFAMYVEVFGSMLATGFGLVVSGALILVLVWLWTKYRHRLTLGGGT